MNPELMGQTEDFRDYYGEEQRRPAEEARKKRLAKAGKRDPNALEGGLELVKRFVASGLGLPGDIAEAVLVLSKLATGDSSKEDPLSWSSEGIRQRILNKDLAPAEANTFRSALETIADFAGGGGGFAVGRGAIRAGVNAAKGAKEAGKAGLGAVKSSGKLDVGLGAASGAASSVASALVQDSNSDWLKTTAPIAAAVGTGVGGALYAGRRALANNPTPYLVSNLERRGYSKEVIDDVVNKLGGFDAPITGATTPAGVKPDVFNQSRIALAEKIKGSPMTPETSARVARENEQVLLDKLGKTGPQAPQAPLREVPTQQATQAGEAVVAGTQVPRNSAVSKFSGIVEQTMKKAKSGMDAAYDSVLKGGAAKRADFDPSDLASSVRSITISMDEQGKSTTELISKLIGDIRTIRPGAVTQETVFDPVTMSNKVVSKVGDSTPLSNRSTSLTAITQRGDDVLEDLATEIASGKLNGAQLVEFDKALNAAFEGAKGYDRVVIAKLKEGVAKTAQQDPAFNQAYSAAKDSARTFYDTFYKPGDLGTLAKAIDPRSEVPMEAVIRNLVSGDKGYQFGDWLSDLGKNYGVKTKDVAKDLVDDMFSQSVSKGFAGDAATVSEKLQSVVNASKGLNNALPFAERSGLGSDYIANLQRQNASKAASELNKWSPSDLANMDQRVAATLIKNDPVAAINKLRGLEAQPREQAWTVVKQLADSDPNVAKALQSATRETVQVTPRSSTMSQVSGVLDRAEDPFVKNLLGPATIDDLSQARMIMQRADDVASGPYGANFDPRDVGRGTGVLASAAGVPHAAAANYGATFLGNVNRYLSAGFYDKLGALGASAKDTAKAFTDVGPYGSQQWGTKYIVGGFNPVASAAREVPGELNDTARRNEFEAALVAAERGDTTTSNEDTEEDRIAELLNGVQSEKSEAPSQATEEIDEDAVAELLSRTR